MNLEDRKPKQLEIKRKEHYDRVYPRQKQLMERLRPLLNKSDVVEENTEPFLYSPNDPLSKVISVKLPNGKSRIKLRKEVNRFSHNRIKAKEQTTKKISQVRPDVLFGLSR